MLSTTRFFVALLSLATAAQCMTSAGRKGHGLIGYGIVMYKPNCASSCRAALITSAINCTDESMDMMDGMSMDMSPSDMTSPECYATDDAFLQTLAFCISQKCTELREDQIEKWWYMNVAGTAQEQPLPKESWRTAMDKVTTPPSEEMVSGDPLNKTMLVNEDDYQSNFNAQGIFEWLEEKHEKYGLVVMLSGFVIPVGFSFLRFIPFPAFLVTRFNAWIIDPPLWGSRHKQPLAGAGLVPTRGQALFIAYLIIINVVLSAVNIRSKQPNAWYSDSWSEIMDYTTNRLGVLSFANIPLLILYSSRNNIMLWMTNWSHSTFLLLHRWVAAIATLQAILHSILWVILDKHLGTYGEESKLPYWYWGAIATVAMSILLPTSILPIRQKIYELFLAWHVALSILTIVGCYYHIIYRFQHQWGYETWIYTAMAVWGFDRIMRFLRLARNGVRTAIVTKVDEDYVRVDIPGVSASGHAYLYFPTLTWRVWENHPFSVAAGVMPPAKYLKTKSFDDGEAGSSTPRKDEINISSSATTASEEKIERSRSNTPATMGLTFFLRRQTGLTAKIISRSSLPCLVEASYGAHNVTTSSKPHLVCIVGGIGISAVLPALRSHPGSSRLYWGVRSTGIVHAMEDMLNGVEKEVFVGERMNLRAVLEEELAYAGKSGVTIAVSGPPAMADEVRGIVSARGRQGGVDLQFIDEAFSW